MRCDYIITGVTDWEINDNEQTSYFVLTGDAYEFAYLVAALTFPSESIRYLFDAMLNPQFHATTCILVSLDGKHGIIRPFTNGQVEYVREIEELVPFFIREDGQHIGVEGAVMKFVNVLSHIIAANPQLANDYRYIPDPSNYNIPPRFTLRHLDQSFGLVKIQQELTDAIRNPEAATDDALAFLYIAKDVPMSFLEYDADVIEKELDFRLAKKAPIAWHFYNFSELTKFELNQRSLRAQWQLQEFKKKFNTDTHTEDYYESIFRYLRSLEDDVLAELTMVGFHNGFEMKPLIMILSERLPSFRNR
jgi:hypothetical protein